MIRWSVADGRYDVTGESLEHLICKNYNQIISTDFVWSVVSKCGVCEHTFFAGELFEMDVWIFSCCSPRNHASDPSPGWLNHLSLVCQAQVVQVQRRYAMAMCKWKDGGGDGVWECGRIGFDYEDSMFHWQLKPLCLRFLYQSLLGLVRDGLPSVNGYSNRPKIHQDWFSGWKHLKCQPCSSEACGGDRYLVHR